MEVKRHYLNLARRQAIIAEWEGKGYRMLHDDFDADWKPGDEPHGTMTFTDEPEPVVETPPVRDLAKEIDQIKAATGIGGAGQKGIAQRIDALEARLEALENK